MNVPRKADSPFAPIDPLVAIRAAQGKIPAPLSTPPDQDSETLGG